jgi:hypothetical protein
MRGLAVRWSRNSGSTRKICRGPGVKKSSQLRLPLWAQLGSNQRPPDYERQMGFSSVLHRFVTLCTRLFCNRIIVEDFTVLYRYGGNPGTKTGTRNNYVCRDVYSESMRYNSRFK